MEIKKLDREKYQGLTYHAVYETKKHYEVQLLENGFQLVLKETDEAGKKEFSDTLFSDWLEEPIAFGLFQEDKMMGFVEGSPEAWHNVFRISNIFVYEEYRKQGLGEKLLNYIVDYVKRKNSYRGIILETQTSNYAAISLYKKMGFHLSRIDIHEYTNKDIENKEVRIDLFMEL